MILDAINQDITPHNKAQVLASISQLETQEVRELESVSLFLGYMVRWITNSNQFGNGTLRCRELIQVTILSDNWSVLGYEFALYGPEFLFQGWREISTNSIWTEKVTWNSYGRLMELKRTRMDIMNLMRLRIGPRTVPLMNSVTCLLESGTIRTATCELPRWRILGYAIDNALYRWQMS